MSTEIEEYGTTVYERNVTALMQLLMKEHLTLDSRMIAEKLIKKDHHYVTQVIRRNKVRLERETVLDRRENKLENASGGRPEVYYQLTERQILILLGATASGPQYDLLYDMLVDAFIRTKRRVLEIEMKQNQPLMIDSAAELDLLLEEKLEERMRELNERFDIIEKKIEENSPKTILKHSFGKAKLSDLK